MRSNPRRWLDEPGPAGPPQLLHQLDGPLPEGARDRVWARLKEKRQPTPRAWPWLMAVPATVAAVAVLLLAPLGTSTAEPVGTTTRLRGEASILQPDGERAAFVTAALFEGDRIRTSADSRLLLSGAGMDVVVEPSTELEVGALGGGTALNLQHGAVVARVAKRHGREPVNIVAGDHRVEVIGTLFEVRRVSGEVSVIVREGMVRVFGPSGEQLVGAGRVFCTSPDPTNRAVSRPALAMLGVIGGEPTAFQPPASLPVVTVVTNESPGSGKAARRVTSLSVRPKRPPVPARATPALNRAPSSALPLPPLAVDTLGERSAPVASADGVAELYQRAVATTDPDEAIALFDRVVVHGEPWDEVASYQAARRAARAQRPDSLERFLRVVDRYPEGTFAVEARLTLIDLLMKRERLGEARAQINAFAAAHPRSERLADLLFVRAELARTREKDCAAAERDYAAAQASPTRGETAAFWRGWCLFELGRRAEGTAVFRDYAHRYPRGVHIEEVRAVLE